MILFITALRAEASPLIRHYKLKKDMAAHKWPVYQNNSRKLIISGTGKIRAAMAAAHLLASEKSRVAAMINYGICGSSSRLFEPGAVLLAHKVQDADTGRNYFPDIFSGHDLRRMSLTCSSVPVTDYPEAASQEIFFDMESAGIMEAGTKYLAPHQTVVLKVISDYLGDPRLDKEKVESLIEAGIPVLERIIADLENLPGSKAAPCETDLLLEKISRELRLTASMRQQLRDRLYSPSPGSLDPESLIKLLPTAGPCSTRERKTIFDQIMRELRT